MQRLVEYVAVSGFPAASELVCTINEVPGFHGIGERYKPVLLDRLPQRDHADVALPLQLSTVSRFMATLPQF